MKKYLKYFMAITCLTFLGSCNMHSHNTKKMIEETILEPTCTTDGIKQISRYCSKCDALMEIETKTIEAKGHELVFHEGQIATCTDHGFESYYTCEQCDYNTYKETNIKNHSFGNATIKNKIFPTCTEMGRYDVYKFCRTCQEDIFIERVILDKLGHQLVHHDKTDPTCLDFGCLSYDTCSVCDYMNIVYVIPKGHRESSDKEIIVSKQPTCTEDGKCIENVYCIDCSRLMRSVEKDIRALGHDYIHHERLDATCSNDGNHEYDTCSRCDYTTFVRIPQRGHVLKSPIIGNIDMSSNPHYEELYYCNECDALVENRIIEPSSGESNFGLESNIIALYPLQKLKLLENSMLSYYSLDSKIASVSKDGVISAHNEGQTIIYVTDNNNENSTFVIVNVTEESFSFNLSENTICVEHTGNVQDVVLNSKYQSKVTFVSTDKNIATINEDGVISALKVGKINIIGYVEGTNLMCIQPLEVVPHHIIKKGDSYMNCYLGKTLNIRSYFALTTPDTITYSSKNSSIASIDQYGNITGNAIGRTDIIITTQKCGRAVFEVNVVARPTVSITNSNYSKYVRISLTWSDGWYRFNASLVSGYEVCKKIELTVYTGNTGYGSQVNFSVTLDNNQRSNSYSHPFTAFGGGNPGTSYTVTVKSGSIYTA